LKRTYTAESEDYVIVMHYPQTSTMNMKKDRIAEGEINMAFKEQEVAKFRANCKRAL